jgi:hypothetical protein
MQLVSSSLVQIVLGAFLAMALALPIWTNAQGAGVRITPALIEETLEPGAVVQYAITIGNQNDTEQTFFLSLRNIEGVQDGGTPIFADTNQEITGYELVDWIALEQTEVTIPAGGQTAVNFTLSLPNDAPPGSRFGGVFVSVDAPELDRSGAAVGYQVANIISIRVAGDANEMASIRQFATEKYFHGSTNVDFTARIENSGNVLVRPTGPVEITNMLGQKVDTITMNESRGAVFPGATRDFGLNWLTDGTGFGRYEAVIALAYGDQGAVRTMSSTATFWILPTNILFPAIGGLVFLLLISYIFVKLYIRRTLARMGYAGRGKAVKRRQKGSSTTLLLFSVLLTVTALFMLILLVLFA